MSDKTTIDTEDIGHIVTADELVMDEETIIREQERMANEKRKKKAKKKRKVVLIILLVIIVAGNWYLFFGKKLFNKSTETVIAIESTENQNVTYVKVNKINGNEITYTLLEAIVEEKADDISNDNPSTSEEVSDNTVEIPSSTEETTDDKESVRPSKGNGEKPTGFPGADISSNDGMPNFMGSQNMPSFVGGDGQMPGFPGNNGEMPNFSVSDGEMPNFPEFSQNVSRTSGSKDSSLDTVSDNAGNTDNIGNSDISHNETNANNRPARDSNSSWGERPSFSGSDGEMPNFSGSNSGTPFNFSGSNSGNGRGQNGSSAILLYNGTSYKLTEETFTELIPVGTDVTTKLGTVTTFSRIASGDCLALVTEEIDGIETIISIYIVG